METLTPPDGAMTREAYYAAQGLPVPNGNGVTANGAPRCQRCGDVIEGRQASAKWCSEDCRRQYRREHANATRPLAEVPKTVDAPERTSYHDDVVDLVGAIAGARVDLLAVTFEYASGWSVTVERVD